MTYNVFGGTLNLKPRSHYVRRRTAYVTVRWRAATYVTLYSSTLISTAAFTHAVSSYVDGRNMPHNSARFVRQRNCAH